VFNIGNCGNNNDDPNNDPTIEALITNYVNDISLSNRVISKDGPTAEDRALQFLIESDRTFNLTALLLLESTTNNVVKFRIEQRYALLTLFFQQTFTAPWFDRGGWLKAPDECDWFGIDCALINVGEIVGLQNVVSKIGLFDNNVLGTIPPDLVLLTAVTSVRLDENQLTGTLPESIGQWTRLTLFDVNSNTLTGTLPVSMEKWTRLESFAVFSNELSGTLPESILRWTRLKSLGLGSNALTGTLPEDIGKLTALTSFEVSENALTGTLPESIGQWTAMSFFTVRFNSLIGTIPKSIENWGLIASAFFDRNQLIGAMPNGICKNIQGFDSLMSDCLSEISCSCCTKCF
jgi:hypothetical protein